MNKVRIANFVSTPVINTTRVSTTKKTNATSKSSTMNCQTMSTVNTNQVSFLSEIGIELSLLTYKFTMTFQIKWFD